MKWKVSVTIEIGTSIAAKQQCFFNEIDVQKTNKKNSLYYQISFDVECTRTKVAESKYE